MFKRASLPCLLLSCVLLAVAACHKTPQTGDVRSDARTRPFADNVSPVVREMLKTAVEQTAYTVSYDPSYVKLDYPGGDVPLESGVCSDVIVRAFRGVGVDLQREVHEDMRAGFASYPKKWGLARPDPNIDHRRVPNLMTFFERKGKAQAATSRAEDYLPGDIVAWDLGGGITHIGIVTNNWSDATRSYLIVHNIGSGARLENVLFSWRIIGHYRYF